MWRSTSESGLGPGSGVGSGELGAGAEARQVDPTSAGPDVRWGCGVRMTNSSGFREKGWTACRDPSGDRGLRVAGGRASRSRVVGAQMRGAGSGCSRAAGIRAKPEAPAAASGALQEVGNEGTVMGFALDAQSGFDVRTGAQDACTSWRQGRRSEPEGWMVCGCFTELATVQLQGRGPRE